MTSTTNEYFINNNAQSNKNSVHGFKYSMEQDSLSQDLHFKMSKKIAQLTKVIYALNTKNDDNEASINVLKMEHGKEIQQILDETNNKVEILEKKLKAHMTDNQKIVDLQQNIKSYDNILDETKKKFETFQNDNYRINKEKDSKHLEQLESLNEQIKYIKSSYEQLQQDYDELEKTMELDKTTIIQNMKIIHEKELNKVFEESRHREEQLNSLISGSVNEVQNQLIEAHKEIQNHLKMKDIMVMDHEKEMLNLNKSLEHLKSENLKNKRIFEFEMEEQKAKVFDLVKQIDQKEDNLKNHLNECVARLAGNSRDLDQTREQMKSLENACKESESIISKYSKEIDLQKTTIEKLQSEIRERVDEMQKLQSKNEEKSLETASKLKQIRDLKSINENLQEKLSEKEGELKNALHKIKSMIEESNEMANSSKYVSVDYEIQIQTLQHGIEELTQERSAERSAVEKMKFNHEIELLESVSKIKRETDLEIEKLNKKREKEFTTREKLYQEEIQKSKDDAQSRLDEERSKASKMIEKLKLELEQVKGEMNSKVKTKEKQISSLDESVLGKEKEIKSLNLQLKEIKDILSSTKKENQKLTQSSIEKNSEIENIRKEIEKFKLLLEEQKVANEKLRKSVQDKVQEDMSEKYNKLSAELDSKWADTLRKETGRIRNDLLDGFAKEKEKMIEKMEKDKKAEIEAIKSKFENQNETLASSLIHYEKEIVLLQNELHHLKSTNESQTLKKIQEIQTMLSECQGMHAEEIAALNCTHDAKIQNLAKQFDDEKFQYMSEMESILESNEKVWNEKHTNLINSITAEQENKMKMKLDELENKHSRQMHDHIRELQTEISLKTQSTIDVHQEELNSLTKQIAALEDQLKVSTNNHRLELERVASAKLKQDLSYQKLEIQFQDSLKENEYLKKQIDEYGNDYSRSQKELVEKLKNQELELRRTFEQGSLNLKTKYDEEAKQILTDFNKAQNLYKDKIRELNKRLMELEEQFNNRPSRDEDMDIIHTLQAQLKVSEKEIERMNEEKRFYQLELTNRETNFNKIFNASPNVGIMNPTQGAIKSKKISNDKMKAFQKLTPLPGSPFHDDPINPSKPLPPSSRKSIDNS